MAVGFDVTVRMQAQVGNVQPAVSALRQQVSGAGSVSIGVDPSSGRAIDALGRNLATVQANARGVDRALRSGGMASSAGDISRLNTQLTQTGRTMHSLQGTIGGAADETYRFGQQAALAGRRFLAFGIGAVSFVKLAGAIHSAAGEALEFQRNMVRLGQLGAVSGSEIKETADTITRLSTTLGVSSKELADTTIYLKGAGLTVNEVKDSIEALAKVSLAPTFSSVRETTEGLIAIRQQFGVSTKDFTSVLGSINAVARDFAAESEDIVEAVRRAGSAFKAAAGDMEPARDQFNEFIGLFTSVRATTRESAESISTSLRTIFGRLQSPQVVKSLRDMGVNLHYTADEARLLGKNVEGQFVGPYRAIGRLSEALRGIPTTDPRFAAVVQQIGGYRQLSRVIPLLREYGTAQKAVASAQAGTASLTRDADKAQEAYLVRLNQVREQFIALVRDIGNSQGFRAMFDAFITGAKAAITLANALKPLLPLLTAVAAIRIGRGLVTFGSGFLNPPKVMARRFSHGGVVPGHGDTDNHHAMVPAGGYFLRKAVSQKLLRAAPEFADQLMHGTPGHDSRRMVPVAAMPGEIFVPPENVRKVGRIGLDRLNKGYIDPRATGGYARGGFVSTRVMGSRAGIGHIRTYSGRTSEEEEEEHATGGIVDTPQGRVKRSPYGRTYNLDKFLAGNIGQRVRLRRVEADPETGELTPRATWYARHRQSRFLQRFASGDIVNEVSPHIDDSVLVGRFRRLMTGRHGEAVMSHIPEGSKLLGYGTTAIAFHRPDGTVVRIGGMGDANRDDRRPVDPLVLQPHVSRRYGKHPVEELPFAPPISDTVDRSSRQHRIMRAFEKRLLSQGKLPTDVLASNIARHNKRIVAIDPEVYRAHADIGKIADFARIKKYAAGGTVTTTRRRAMGPLTDHPEHEEARLVGMFGPEEGRRQFVYARLARKMKERALRQGVGIAEFMQPKFAVGGLVAPRARVAGPAVDHPEHEEARIMTMFGPVEGPKQVIYAKLARKLKMGATRQGVSIAEYMRPKFAGGGVVPEVVHRFLEEVGLGGIDFDRLISQFTTAKDVGSKRAPGGTSIRGNFYPTTRAVTIREGIVDPHRTAAHELFHGLDAAEARRLGLRETYASQSGQGVFGQSSQLAHRMIDEGLGRPDYFDPYIKAGVGNVDHEAFAKGITEFVKYRRGVAEGHVDPAHRHPASQAFFRHLEGHVLPHAREHYGIESPIVGVTPPATADPMRMAAEMGAEQTPRRRRPQGFKVQPGESGGITAEQVEQMQAATRPQIADVPPVPVAPPAPAVPPPAPPEPEPATIPIRPEVAAPREPSSTYARTADRYAYPSHLTPAEVEQRRLFHKVVPSHLRGANPKFEHLLRSVPSLRPLALAGPENEVLTPEAHALAILQGQQIDPKTGKVKTDTGYDVGTTTKDVQQIRRREGDKYGLSGDMLNPQNNPGVLMRPGFAAGRLTPMVSEAGQLRAEDPEERAEREAREERLRQAAMEKQSLHTGAQAKMKRELAATLDIKTTATPRKAAVTKVAGLTATPAIAHLPEVSAFMAQHHPQSGLISPTTGKPSRPIIDLTSATARRMAGGEFTLPKSTGGPYTAAALEASRAIERHFAGGTAPQPEVTPPPTATMTPQMATIEPEEWQRMRLGRTARPQAPPAPTEARAARRAAFAPQMTPTAATHPLLTEAERQNPNIHHAATQQYRQQQARDARGTPERVQRAIELRATRQAARMVPQVAVPDEDALLAAYHGAGGTAFQSIGDVERQLQVPGPAGKYVINRFATPQKQALLRAVGERTGVRTHLYGRTTKAGETKGLSAAHPHYMPEDAADYAAGMAASTTERRPPGRPRKDRSSPNNPPTNPPGGGGPRPPTGGGGDGGGPRNPILAVLRQILVETRAGNKLLGDLPTTLAKTMPKISERAERPARVRRERERKTREAAAIHLAGDIPSAETRPPRPGHVDSILPLADVRTPPGLAMPPLHDITANREIAAGDIPIVGVNPQHDYPVHDLRPHYEPHPIPNPIPLVGDELGQIKKGTRSPGIDQDIPLTGGYPMVNDIGPRRMTDAQRHLIIQHRGWQGIEGKNILHELGEQERLVASGGDVIFNRNNAAFETPYSGLVTPQAAAFQSRRRRGTADRAQLAAQHRERRRLSRIDPADYLSNAVTMNENPLTGDDIQGEIAASMANAFVPSIKAPAKRRSKFFNYDTPNLDRIGQFFKTRGRMRAFNPESRMGRMAGRVGNLGGRLGGFKGIAGGAAAAALTMAPDIINAVAPHLLDFDRTGANHGAVHATRTILGGVQGAATGASIGAFAGGPVGAAIGGVVGGLHGLVSASKEASKELRALKVEDAFGKLDKAIDDIVAGRLQAGTGTATAAVNEPFRQADRHQAETGTKGFFARNLGGDASFIGRNVNRLFGDNAAVERGYRNQEKEAAESRRQFVQEHVAPRVGQLRAYNEAVARNVKVSANIMQTTGPEGQPLGENEMREQQQMRLAEFRRRGGAETARRVVEATPGLTMEEYEKEIDRLIVESNRQRVQTEATTKALNNLEVQTQKFGRIGAAIDATVAAMGNLQHGLDATEAAFSGALQAIPTRSHVAAAGNLGGPDVAAYNKAVDFVGGGLQAGGGGELARGFTDTAREVNRTASILPSVIGQANEGGGDPVAGILKGLDAAHIPETIRGRIDDLLRGMNPEDVAKLASENVQKLSDTLIKEGFGHINEVLQNAAKALEERVNNYNAGLVKNQEMINKVGEAQDKYTSLQVQAAQSGARIRGEIVGRPSQTDLTPETLTVPFQRRQERLTGLAGAAARDPREIAARLRETQTQVVQATQRRDANPHDLDASKALVELQGNAQRLGQALEHLADPVERNAILQERLSRIEEQRNAKLSFVQRLATANPQERAQMRRNAAFADIAVRQGTLATLPRAVRQGAVEHLQSVGEMNLPGYGGRSGSDVLKNLLVSTGLQTGHITPQDEKQRLGVMGQIHENNQTAVAAQGEVVRNQETLQGQFFSELRDMQREFFAKLASTMAEAEQRDVTAGIGDTQGQLQQNKKATAAVDFFRGRGVTLEQARGVNVEGLAANLRKQEELPGRAGDIKKSIRSGKGELASLATRAFGPQADDKAKTDLAGHLSDRLDIRPEQVRSDIFEQANVNASQGGAPAEHVAAAVHAFAEKHGTDLRDEHTRLIEEAKKTTRLPEAAITGLVRAAPEVTRHLQATGTRSTDEILGQTGVLNRRLESLRTRKDVADRQMAEAQAPPPPPAPIVAAPLPPELPTATVADLSNPRRRADRDFVTRRRLVTAGDVARAERGNQPFRPIDDQGREYPAGATPAAATAHAMTRVPMPGAGLQAVPIGPVISPAGPVFPPTMAGPGMPLPPTAGAVPVAAGRPRRRRSTRAEIQKRLQEITLTPEESRTDLQTLGDDIRARARQAAGNRKVAGIAPAVEGTPKTMVAGGYKRDVATGRKLAKQVGNRFVAVGGKDLSRYSDEQIAAFHQEAGIADRVKPYGQQRTIDMDRADALSRRGNPSAARLIRERVVRQDREMGYQPPPGQQQQRRQRQVAAQTQQRAAQANQQRMAQADPFQAFSQSVQTLNGATGGFSQAVDKLSGIAEVFRGLKIPERIEVQHGGRAEVVHNGAQLLNALQGDYGKQIAETVITQLKEQMPNLIKGATL